MYRVDEPESMTTDIDVQKKRKVGFRTALIKAAGHCVVEEASAFNAERPTSCHEVFVIYEE